MKIYNFLLMITLVLITSCDSCEPLVDTEPCNTNSQMLTVELYGADVRRAIENLSSFCNHPSSFDVDVQIQVFTATELDGVVTPDAGPPLYDNTTPTNLVGNAGRDVITPVPETGPYHMEVTITSQECSACCHGDFYPYQCGLGTSNDGTRCDAGYPVVQHVESFGSETRPCSDFKYVASNDLMNLSCNCDCDTDC